MDSPQGFTGVFLCLLSVLNSRVCTRRTLLPRGVSFPPANPSVSGFLKVHARDKSVKLG